MSLILQVPSRRDVGRAYALWSHFYDAVAAPWESGARMRALEALTSGRGARLLDVGIASGGFFTQILKRVGRGALVYGVDLAPGMVRKAHDRVRNAGAVPRLAQADAVALPYPADTFDALLSSYVLDLMPLDDIFRALSQFHRVLKPGGRLVLVNLSKIDPDRRTWYERSYEALPSAARAYVLGGCRPVCLTGVVTTAGFTHARRALVRQALSSEIVVADKPVRNADDRRAA